MMESSCYVVPAAALADREVFEAFSVAIAPAARATGWDTGPGSPELLLERAVAGEVVVVVFGEQGASAGDGVALFELIDGENGERGLNCLAIVGEFAKHAEALGTMAEGIARAHGCRYIIGSGREGWVRALRKLGYRHVATTVAKDLRVH